MTAILRVLFIFLLIGPALAAPEESTEPPTPRAAPLGVVNEEALPRAGGVLVFGGTRGTGLALVKELVHRGEKVTVLARATADVEPLKALGVNIVAGDVLKPDDLARVFIAAPYRVVVSTVGGRKDDWRADVDGNRNIIAAAKSAGIPRMILISAVGAGESASAVPWYLRPFRHDFLAAKTSAEQALRTSGLAYTILRVGWLLDKPASGKATMSADRTFGWVARADAGRLLADCVRKDDGKNSVLTAYDPTYKNVLSLVF